MIVAIDISLLALVIALTALAFTVLSFWWIHVRKGRLRLSSVPVFAGTWTQQHGKPEIMLRLPLVLYNSGARACVVEEMRLFTPGWRGEAFFKWERFAETMDPSKGTDRAEDFPTPYAVDPRRTASRYVDFTYSIPGELPEARPTAFVLQVRLDGRDRWEELGTTTLHLGHMSQPGSFLVYRNTPTLCPGEANEGTTDAWARHVGVTRD